MSTAIIFEEVQGFVKKTGEVFLKILCGFILLGCLLVLVFKKENNREAFFSLVAVLVIILLISYFLRQVRLITQIRSDGLYIRFSPFHRTFKRFSWDSIDEIYIRKYDPIREFSGWGLRFGPSGTAFNISGNAGIQLVLKDGSRFLIGTNMPDEINNILMKLGKIRFHGPTNN